MKMIIKKRLFNYPWNHLNFLNFSGCDPIAECLQLEKKRSPLNLVFDQIF